MREVRFCEEVHLIFYTPFKKIRPAGSVRRLPQNLALRRGSERGLGEDAVEDLHGFLNGVDMVDGKAALPVLFADAATARIVLKILQQSAEHRRALLQAASQHCFCSADMPFR